MLVLLVVRDGAGWLRDTLRSLARQTYARLGIVAVDNASTDGSAELLVRALGEGRVLALDRNGGLAGALRSASELPAAQQADYLLVLHDDTALAPDAIARLVEAAEGIGGVERVGVVGPKVVDWDDPRVLREVGRSTDAFGHPYTPLQDGELDQGQYDRVLEVLFVSSCAMLISAEAWRRTGAFDERLGGHYDDLDFCWRARLAGFRVLMTPLAQARHRGAAARGERDRGQRRPTRYHAERAGLAAMLKDYGFLTLVWLFPLYAVFGVGRLALYAITRRFETALELLAAWGWNLVHLPGTLRRRLRAQSVRRVPDRTVRRFMAGTLRVPRWFEQAGAFLEEELEAGTEEAPRVRDRARSLVADHPVLVASALAVLIGALAIRPFIGPEPLLGGAIAAWPARASEFLHELLSPARTTILGGDQAASPAVAGFAGLSWLAFGSPALAAKILLCGLPLLAGVTMYRTLARQTGEAGAAVVGASVYALSAVLFWSFSEGRIPLLVGLAVLPSIWDRLEQAFSPHGPSVRRVPFLVGFGLALALAVAVSPGLALGAGLMALAALPSRRAIRGLGWVIGGALCAAALVFPIVPDLARAPAATLASFVGTADVWAILRAAPGSGPGTRLTALFLPIAALVSFSVVGGALRSKAWRAMLLVLAASGLAWAWASRYLPEVLTNAPVYLIVAALGDAALIGFGLASLGSGISRERFGYRQVAAGLLAVVLTVGFGGQILEIALGGWAVAQGEAGLPAAWPIIASGPADRFEILWIGRVDGRPLPAPAGDPQGIVEAGPASVRYALTDQDGSSALDTGRGVVGPGYAYLRSVVQELISGSTSTAGALLGPLGVRYVVAAAGDLPAAVLDRLDAQLDLDRRPAGGLTIYRNARSLPVASVVTSRGFARTATSDDLEQVAASAPPQVDPLASTVDGWTGQSEGGYLYLARQRTSSVRASAGGHALPIRSAFGWATGFPDTAPGPVRVWFAGGWLRTLEMSVLAALWMAALWITRKPGSA